METKKTIIQMVDEYHTIIGENTREIAAAEIDMYENNTTVSDKCKVRVLAGGPVLTLRYMEDWLKAQRIQDPKEAKRVRDANVAKKCSKEVREANLARLCPKIVIDATRAILNSTGDVAKANEVKEPGSPKEASKGTDDPKDVNTRRLSKEDKDAANKAHKESVLSPRL